MKELQIGGVDPVHDETVLEFDDESVSPNNDFLDVKVESYAREEENNDLNYAVTEASDSDQEQEAKAQSGRVVCMPSGMMDLK